jgi:cytochrome b involved in lipid metabolism/monoamine oxidase
MSNNTQIIYDYLIVGAGISGLYTAYNLNKKYPSAKICILEATQYIGGRLHSIKYDGLIMDGGGARFNTDQNRIISLIKELGLWDKVVPLNTDSTYKPVYSSSLKTKSLENYKSLEINFPTLDDFIIYMKKYIKEKKISRTQLINTTILDFALLHFSKEYPHIKEYLINIYPYYSELAILNAVEGINLFSNELAKKTKYFMLNGGLEQLTETLYNKLKDLKETKKCIIDIYKETSVLEIQGIFMINNNQNGYVITTNNTDTDNTKFIANKVILTIPKNKLINIKIKPIKTNTKLSSKLSTKLSSKLSAKLTQLLKNINSVQNEPLYRIYARYPLDKKTHKVWFDGLGKIVTNLPIKYIIPINYDKGVIMISYTDSKFADYWVKQVSEGTFENTLNTQLKQLFPDIDIPKAKWFKHCSWISGAGYWKKGYDRKVIMPKMIEPLGRKNNLYICGENYSSHQAWVEGSLETSDMVLKAINNYSHSHNSHSHNFAKKQDLENPARKHSFFKKSRAKNSFLKNPARKYSMQDLENPARKYSRKQKAGFIKSSTKLTKKKEVGIIKNKEYTLEEVSKHNKKSDAWIAINGKVADVTKWIPLHPGGDIIMKGVGKDASALFKSIGHDEYAKKMLKKYQIGILKK